MNLFKKIENEIRPIVVQMHGGSVVLDKIEVTPPKDPAHGDMATNAALVIAPQVSQKPIDIARELLDGIQKIDGIAKAEIAGPGFINITLASAMWQRAVIGILSEGLGYGNSEIGKGKKVNVEYVSANPTGPMHVGHGRGAVYGDALATLLLKAGYNVTKEYYINDAGSQVDKLADSAFLRYREACGENIGEIPEGLYPGDYLVPVGKGLVHAFDRKLLGQPREEWLPVVREFTIDAMMALIKDDLFSLGVEHDVFTSERAISQSGKVGAALTWLDDRGLIYTGVLEPPKGKAPEDWEPREQTLFKSTEFGDDCDRAVKKSDGSWTYFAPDIAYHFDKCQRGFNVLVNIFGADHGGYVKRLNAVVKAFSDNTVKLEVKLCQLVKLTRGGEPLKMSKRAGTFITVREVVDEVGRGVFRFIMLTRKNDAPLDFDFDKVVEQSKDNPVFYVQYAHARAHSVMRNALADLPEAMKQAQKTSPDILSHLTHPAELALIRLMCNWPRVVEQAAAAFEPHRIAFYLQDLAAEFHSLWNLGNDDPSLRFLLKDNIELSAARITLARAVSTVIASGLMVLGVEPLEEMR
jgi:arginyl-tRNA synthetase